MTTNPPPAGVSGATATAEAVQARSPASHNPYRERRWLALGVILIAQIMILLDATVVNVALPSAQADLGFSNAARPWVVTAYLLALGSLLLVGRRPLLGGRRDLQCPDPRRHPPPPGARPARAPRRDQRAVLTHERPGDVSRPATPARPSRPTDPDTTKEHTS